MNKWLNSFDITDTQWPYYRFWLIMLLIVEGLMLIFNQLLFEFYILIAALFLGGFLLRFFHLYPGQDEPLLLDFAAVVFSVIYAFLGESLEDSPWRFLLILCSSLIIIPHFIFIALKK